LNVEKNKVLAREGYGARDSVLTPRVLLPLFYHSK
jgi:hypothetical protein